MDNQGFLAAIEKSFVEFIKSGTSRSTKKLVPLHGAIAKDILARLGGTASGYSVMSQGYATGKEGTISGRYMEKKVDITIFRNAHAVGGIAVKFVMQNYSQNSNNYFENMLGETANIRSARCPYFQVFIIPDKLPYYNRDKEIQHWESFTDNNIHKYCVLDRDNPEVSFHSPNKMLIYVVKLPDVGDVRTLDSYRREYQALFARRGEGGFLDVSAVARFSNAVILNDYETFADKVHHAIMAL